jgi:NitT/TauT family transport system permease protein
MNAVRLPGWARLLAPIVVGIAGLAAWYAFVASGSAPRMLPDPFAVVTEFVDRFGLIAEAAGITGTNALVGLIAGSLLAILLAALAATWRPVDGMTAPLVAALAVVPIVALTPIFNTMFASTSSIPRRLIVLIAAFFPVFVNTLRGLRQTEPVHEELLRSYAATPAQQTRVLRLPAALPFVFTGLRVAASAAVIAAVVSEYFGGLQRGLGPAITSAASSGGYPRAWAYVVAAIALGLVAYVAALLLERLAMPWNRTP